MQPTTPENGASSFAYSILSDNAFSKQFQRWTSRKKRQDVVRGVYTELGLDKYAERIGQCASILFADAKKGDDDNLEVYFHSPQYCRDRHCSTCQGKRSNRWLAIFHEAIPRLLADNPSLRAIFLTLTIRNCPIEQLRETLAKLSAGFSRMTRRKDWPSNAWIKIVEITRGQDGTAHPHLHVVMFLDSKYFSGRGYIKHERWRELWRDCLGVDYLPMVNVQAIKPRKDDNKGIGNYEEVIQYTAKYGFKESELVGDVGWFDEFHKQVRGTRAISIGGDLRPYVRQAKEDYKASRETVDVVASTDSQADDVSHESKESHGEIRESHSEILDTVAFVWNPKRGQYSLLTEETIEDVANDLMDGVPFGRGFDRSTLYRIYEFFRPKLTGLVTQIRELRKLMGRDVGDVS